MLLDVSADQIEPLGSGACDVGHGALTFEDQGETRRHPIHYAAVYTRESGALKLRIVSVGME